MLCVLLCTRRYNISRCFVLSDVFLMRVRVRENRSESGRVEKVVEGKIYNKIYIIRDKCERVAASAGGGGTKRSC